MPPATIDSPPFATAFEVVTGHEPMLWQRRLFDLLRRGRIPDAVDLPTGLGKTSVMAIWLLARAFRDAGSVLPRRLVYVVDRRVVVDQATAEAERISTALSQDDPVASELRSRLGLRPEPGPPVLPISTLRGGRADDREWTYDAAAPAIVVGTIDMIGSRLLFSGYRMSQWSRSMQAGLIGVDSLIVLDEAHLSPAFCEAVPRALQLQVSMSGVEEVPPARFLPLSATLGNLNDERTFRLEPADEDDRIVVRRTGRLGPTKCLTLTEVSGATGGLVETLAESAAKRDGKAQAVLVYCNSRKDANATARKLREALKKARKTSEKECEHDVRLITGARRGHERDALVCTDTYRVFTYDKDGNRIAPADGRTRFLVCTAAGEVGADLDADAAITDFVPLERMVQRLGRVNRRGEGARPTPVAIYYDPATLTSSLSEKDETKKAAAARLLATKTALETLPRLDGGGHDGSPRHLGAIEPNVRKTASTPPPEVIPIIEREHLEAWALTSLKAHPGRPDVEPFLRGDVEDDPQTTVVWRADAALLAQLPDALVEQALAVARLRPAEELEAPSSEVADILTKRLKSLRKGWDNPADGQASVTRPLYLLVFKRGKLAGRRRLAPDSADPDRIESGGGKIPPLEDDPKRLLGLVENATVLLQPKIGGLEKDGALADCDERPGLHIRPDLVVRRFWPKDDDGKPRIELIGAPPSLIETEGEDALRAPVPRCSLGLRRAWSAKVSGATEDDEGSILEYLKPWDVDGETGASSRRSQPLDEHHAWAKAEMQRLAIRLNLSSPLADTLIRAIAVHDLGKDRSGWQNGVGAPHDDGRPYAKSGGRGPGVGSYRHEFGSLRDVLYRPAHCLDAMDGDLRDLALHLIAGHHGRSRPSIPAEDEQEIFEEVLDQDALDAALRYIRLQRRWGPWGLAWLEALFRSVDATVSRRLDRGEEPAEIEAAR